MTTIELTPKRLIFALFKIKLFSLRNIGKEKKGDRQTSRDRQSWTQRHKQLRQRQTELETDTECVIEEEREIYPSL